MNTKADRPECECRAELQEHEVRSNSGITRKAREKCECRAELQEHEVRSNSGITRKAREKCECRAELREHEVRSNLVLTRNAVEKCEVEEQAPPSPLAPLHKFCYYILMCCDVFLHRPRHKQDHVCGGC